MTKKRQGFDKDLTRLIKKGLDLYYAIFYECCEEDFRESCGNDMTEEELDILISGLPKFRMEYQQWYSEARALVRQVLPDRSKDFTSYYEYPHPREKIKYQNYMIKDYLQELTVRHYSALEGHVVVDGRAAVPEVRQQLGIVEAAKAVFDSRLFDLRQILQADLFDSELDAARELAKAGHLRAAGAVCGVVIEKHLGQICDDHSVSIGRKNPTINDLGEALKGGEVIDLPVWRRLQGLADIRNVCCHFKGKEPTRNQVEDLIAGANQVIKSIF